MSEFIIAVIVISAVLMVISKARKKSDEVKREVPPHKVSESEVKPIVKPLTTNTNDAAENAPIIKAEENIVVAISPKVAVSSKERTKDIQIPKDSSLRRHTLNQMHSLLEFCKENRPSDSSLSRHYDQLVELKLHDYTNDTDEILCLLSFYENYFKEVVATEIASVKTIANTTSTSDIDTEKSTLPEDSALRRHAMQLPSN
jgi:hypothetical protein